MFAQGTSPHGEFSCLPRPGALPRRQSARGFTLIELLVVLGHLTLFAGLVGPRYRGTNWVAPNPKLPARRIADLDKSLELFKLDVGRYPTTEEGLKHRQTSR